MYSRKYKIDSVTSLIEALQITRQKKFEIESHEYSKMIEKDLQRFGLARRDVIYSLGFIAGMLSFLDDQRLSMLFTLMGTSYVLATMICDSFYTGRPELHAIIVNKDNIDTLSEYFTDEQKTEIKGVLTLFNIDWDIDLNDLKRILNTISQQIDKNNSTALFAERPVDINALVSWYRPVENEQRHQMAHANS